MNQELICLDSSSDEDNEIIQEDLDDVLVFEEVEKTEPELITLDDDDTKEEIVDDIKSIDNEKKKEITTKEDDDEEEEIEIDPYERRTKLFVNYLPQGLTDVELNMIFMEEGPIKESFIFRDRVTQYSYGYGIVEYEYPEDAAKAIKHKNDMQVQGKRLQVIYSREMSGGYSNLYYCNVDSTVSKENIMAAFKPFGELLQFKLLLSANGQSFGKGFVRYANRFQAVLAIKELNEAKTFPGSSSTMQVSFAEEHGKQKAPIYYNIVKKAKNFQNNRSIKARLGFRGGRGRHKFNTFRRNHYVAKGGRRLAKKFKPNFE